MKPTLKTLLTPVRWLLSWSISWLLAVVIVFEEWGWDPLRRFLGIFVQRLGLQRLESWLAQLPPYAALVCLAIPSLLLIPAKLSAFALIARGQVVLGSIVFIAAKIIGTAIVASIFSCIKPQLLKLAWFAKIYQTWTQYKEKLLERMRATYAWKLAKIMKLRAARRLSQWWRSLKN